MFQKEFTITNLSCEACVKLSTAALNEIPGVTSASVDLKSGRTVIQSRREIAPAEIRSALDEVGKETDIF